MSSPCLCTVLRAATRRIAARYDAALAPVGVNIAQFSLMRTVARTEPVTLTELGLVTELDRSTVGRNVRVLERQGFLALRRGEDQRQAVVSVTMAGRAALSEGAPLWDAVQTELEARLGSGPSGQLRTLLNAL